MARSSPDLSGVLSDRGGDRERDWSSRDRGCVRDFPVSLDPTRRLRFPTKSRHTKPDNILVAIDGFHSAIFEIWCCDIWRFVVLFCLLSGRYLPQRLQEISTIYTMSLFQKRLALLDDCHSERPGRPTFLWLWVASGLRTSPTYVHIFVLTGPGSHGHTDVVVGQTPPSLIIVSIPVR